MIIAFAVPGEPKGKARPRTVQIAGHASTYTPKETVMYENLVRLYYQQAARGLRLSGPIQAEIVSYTIYIESWATHILLANDIESCIWHLAAPIKSINKLRRVNLATAADPDMSKDEVQIKRQTANHDLETDIGELVSCLNWLAGRYSIAAEEIRKIKSYKVQRTRDRIELETGSICKKSC